MMVQENTLGSRVRSAAEKISIVKRRLQNNDPDIGWGKGLQLKLEDRAGVKDMVLNLDLAPGDSKFIPLEALEQEPLKVLRGIGVERPVIEEGRIVFNFRLKTDDTLKMLTMSQVGQMLQISKSFLLRLVKAKKIKSYKFGRLRRFLLTDVIDYLSFSEDQVVVSKKNKPNGKGYISRLDH
jgi:excisionase family DNA binding protein